MLSLQELAIKTIIKNDIACDGQHYLQRLIAEFCEKHPEHVPYSPQSYWKLRSSYLFLSNRNVKCNYFGPGECYTDKTVNTFLKDPSNLTTKFINNELEKYVRLDKSRFIPREMLWNGIIVPYKAYFEFTQEYIKFANRKYKELSVETAIMNTSYIRRNGYIKYLPYNMYFQFNDIFTDFTYKYKPVTYICSKDNIKNLLHSIMAFAADKDKPVFVFDDELMFVNECVDQRDCEHILQPFMERIRWFRTTIHAQFMSELHFMLLDCDIIHRILNIITLYPSVYFKIKDESLGEAQQDEA
jgi:hypothetical protein